MERARGTWTDERLDDLSSRVETGFVRLDAEMRALRTDLGARIDRLQVSIDALQRLMIQFAGGMTLAIIATLLSVIATRG